MARLGVWGDINALHRVDVGSEMEALCARDIQSCIPVSTVGLTWPTADLWPCTEPWIFVYFHSRSRLWLITSLRLPVPRGIPGTVLSSGTRKLQVLGPSCSPLCPPLPTEQEADWKGNTQHPGRGLHHVGQPGAQLGSRRASPSRGRRGS